MLSNKYVFWLSRLILTPRPDREAFLYTMAAGALDKEAAEDNSAALFKNVPAFQLEKSKVLGTSVSKEKL